MGGTNWDVGWGCTQERVRSWVHGPCTAVDDMSSLIPGLRSFSNGLSVAEHLTYFSSRGAEVGERLTRGREGVNTVIGVLETPQQLCDDYRSVIKIRAGIETLRRIGAIPNDPAAAAAAFGQVFSGLGELSSRLGFPANSYSDFLAASGNFFSDMRGGIGLGPADRRLGQQGVS